jgi:hypothetical protein
VVSTNGRAIVIDAMTDATYHDQISSTGAKAVWIFNGFHRKKLDSVTAVLRGFAKHMLRDERAMFVLQRAANFLGMFRL